LLREKGHAPYPVHPTIDEVAGFAVYEACTLVLLRTGQF